MSNNKQTAVQINKNSLNIIAIVFVVVIVGIFGFVAMSSSNNTSSSNSTGTTVTQEGDKQVLELTAKGGYSPGTVTAEANKPTILRVKTNNTFDCSSSLNIPSLSVRKSLPSTGTTDIEIAAQAPGTSIKGTCGMGMYNFTIKFT
jgi:plastocyanin domain-containing protein